MSSSSTGTASLHVASGLHLERGSQRTTAAVAGKKPPAFPQVPRSPPFPVQQKVGVPNTPLPGYTKGSKYNGGHVLSRLPRNPLRASTVSSHRRHDDSLGFASSGGPPAFGLAPSGCLSLRQNGGPARPPTPMGRAAQLDGKSSPSDHRGQSHHQIKWGTHPLGGGRVPQNRRTTNTEAVHRCMG